MNQNTETSIKSKWQNCKKHVEKLVITKTDDLNSELFTQGQIPHYSQSKWPIRIHKRLSGCALHGNNWSFKSHWQEQWVSLNFLQFRTTFSFWSISNISFIIQYWFDNLIWTSFVGIRSKQNTWRSGSCLGRKGSVLA